MTRAMWGRAENQEMISKSLHFLWNKEAVIMYQVDLPHKCQEGPAIPIPTDERLL